MVPEVGVTSPMIIAMVVVLPAPLPPSSPVTEPAGRLNEMPSTAVAPLKRLTRLSAAMAGTFAESIRGSGLAPQM